MRTDMSPESPVWSDSVSDRGDKIELGSGLLGSGHWRLTCHRDGPTPPDDHHISKPLVVLHIDDRGGFGRPVPAEARPGSLGQMTMGVVDGYSTAHVFGEVAFGFDRVQVDCVGGPSVEAVIVDCSAHLPFNYYVAEVGRRVAQVTATGPSGITATKEQQ